MNRLLFQIRRLIPRSRPQSPLFVWSAHRTRKIAISALELTRVRVLGADQHWRKQALGTRLEFTFEYILVSRASGHMSFHDQRLLKTRREDYSQILAIWAMQSIFFHQKPNWRLRNLWGYMHNPYKSLSENNQLPWPLQPGLLFPLVCCSVLARTWMIQSDTLHVVVHENQWEDTF